MSASLILVAGTNLAPRVGQPVLAMFPPWWSNEQDATAAVEAGGVLVGFGRWAGEIVTMSKDRHFSDHLHRAGALLLLDARGLAGCMTEIPQDLPR